MSIWEIDTFAPLPDYHLWLKHCQSCPVQIKEELGNKTAVCGYVFLLVLLPSTCEVFMDVSLYLQRESFVFRGKVCQINKMMKLWRNITSNTTIKFCILYSDKQVLVSLTEYWYFTKKVTVQTAPRPFKSARSNSDDFSNSASLIKQNTVGKQTHHRMLIIQQGWRRRSFPPERQQGAW